MLKTVGLSKLYCLLFLLFKLYNVDANIAPHKNAVLLLGNNVIFFSLRNFSISCLIKIFKTDKNILSCILPYESRILVNALYLWHISPIEQYFTFFLHSTILYSV